MNQDVLARRLARLERIVDALERSVAKLLQRFNAFQVRRQGLLEAGEMREEFLQHEQMIRHFILKVQKVCPPDRLGNQSPVSYGTNGTNGVHPLEFHIDKAFERLAGDQE